MRLIQGLICALFAVATAQAQPSDADFTALKNRVTALEGQVDYVVTAEASNAPFLNLVWPQSLPVPDYFELTFENVVANGEYASPVVLGESLTVFVSQNYGASFDTGHKYISIGMNINPVNNNASWLARRFADAQTGEPWTLNSPVPYNVPFIFPIQRMDMGWMLGIDSADDVAHGLNGTARVFNTGGVAGHPTTPSYMASVTKAMGYDGTPSPIPPLLGGGTRWNSDPPGITYSWPSPTLFSGHYFGTGQINAFQFRVDTLVPGATFSGRFQLRGRQSAAFIPPPPPPPPPTWSQIGSFLGPHAFDGITNQASPDGSFAVSTSSAWVGKLWSAPVAITTAKIYASSNDGFVYQWAGAVTVELWASDHNPTGPNDGTMLGTQTFSADAPGLVVTFTGLPATPHLAHWYVVRYPGGATSLYCAEAILN